MFIIQLYFYDSISEYMFFTPAKKKRKRHIQKMCIKTVHMSVICCTFPITPQPMWSRVFLFPHFSVWLVDTDGSAYQRAFFYSGCKKKKQPCPTGLQTQSWSSRKQYRPYSTVQLLGQARKFNVENGDELPAAKLKPLVRTNYN